MEFCIKIELIELDHSAMEDERHLFGDTEDQAWNTDYVNRKSILQIRGLLQK